jgi:hypothetical protein
MLLATILAAVLAVSRAAAAEPDAVLYEVTESVRLAVHGGPHRIATASLMGWVKKGTAICPRAFAEALRVEKCSVLAVATNDLDLASGKGPVRGTFTVVIQDGNKIDAPETVVVDGTIEGGIDLTPALGRPSVPLGHLRGRWKAEGVPGGPLTDIRTTGTLTGTFRLPFVYGVPNGCLDDGDPTDCVHVSKPSYRVGDAVVDLQPHEYSLAMPTVRLEIDFVESPPHDEAL